MRVLVTGGAGFIGSNVVDAYVEKGYEVLILDNLSTGKEENLNKKAKFVKADVRDFEAVKKIVSDFKPDVVSHHAAQIDVRKSVEDPQFDAEVNIIGIINLLQAIKDYNVKKFIFASSGGASYGEQIYFPADEEHPQNPESPYGICKLTSEKYLRYYKRAFGLSYISLRYSNVYGPRQDPLGEAGVVAIFTSRLLRKEPCVIYGDGKQTRDYIFIADVVEANLAAIGSTYNGPINVGTGIETDVNTIYSLLCEITGFSGEAVYAPARVGEQRRSVISNNLLKEVLGVENLTPLRIGLEKTVEYFRSTAL
ncbi:MAG: SDR family NAD(P)-dependent oxidoreductase [Deltaproteobacteria bacterium]|nr:SDR family NAD(P)-dependent oxidoreductase [Deltaproteobacteria bacterium]